jgi:opacity protein-like surface antigen
MKLHLLATTVVFTGLCSPAIAGTDMAPMHTDSKDMKQMAEPASDAGFYVGAYGGAQFSTDYGDNKQTVTDGLFGFKDTTHQQIHSFWGGVGGIKAGYNFKSVPVCDTMSLRIQPAVEAEALYIGDDSHASDLAFGGSTEHFTSNSGDFFLNGIVRFKNSSIVTPYIGIGAGLQYITTHTQLSVPFLPVTVTGLDTSDLDFAGQAMFGVDVAVAKHISVFSEYKFIDAIGTDAKSGNIPADLGGGTYRFKPDQIQQNLITAGVRYTF